MITWSSSQKLSMWSWIFRHRLCELFFLWWVYLIFSFSKLLKWNVFLGLISEKSPNCHKERLFGLWASDEYFCLIAEFANRLQGTFPRTNFENVANCVFSWQDFLPPAKMVNDYLSDIEKRGNPKKAYGVVLDKVPSSPGRVTYYELSMIMDGVSG